MPWHSAANLGTRWTGAKGSHEYVFSVLGNVPQQEDMEKLEQFTADEVTVTYEWERD